MPGFDQDQSIQGGTDDTIIGNASDGLKINLRNAAGTETGTLTTPLIVSLVDGQKATYSVGVVNLSAGALPTDILTLSGSATKTVRLLGFEISGTQGTASVKDVILLKRSSANSGGTTTTQTAVPHDSNDAAATAVVKTYTANATTLGTLVGNIRSSNYDFTAANLNNSSNVLRYDFGCGSEKAPVLRGTSEFLAVNLNGTTVTGNSINMWLTWTEE